MHDMDESAIKRKTAEEDIILGRYSLCDNQVSNVSGSDTPYVNRKSPFFKRKEKFFLLRV